MAHPIHHNHCVALLLICGALIDANVRSDRCKCANVQMCECCWNCRCCGGRGGCGEIDAVGTAAAVVAAVVVVELLLLL